MEYVIVVVGLHNHLLVVYDGGRILISTFLNFYLFKPFSA